MPNALIDETRTERLPINLPFLPQVRVSETIRHLLEREKPANESWADFAISSMLQRVIHARTLRFDLDGAKSLLVTVLGTSDDGRHLVSPVGKVDMTGVTAHDGCQKPVQMNLRTAMVAVGKHGRQ